MRLASIIGALVCAVLLVGCGGGNSKTAADDGGGRPTPTPTVTIADYNVALLTSVLLRKEDLGPGFEGGAPSNPISDTSRSLSSVFTDGVLRIQSTVAVFSTSALAESEFQKNRRIFPLAGAAEQNYRINGTETAFLDTLQKPPGLAAWALADRYIVLIHIAPIDPASTDPRAQDRARFDQLAALVGTRLRALIDDPASVTPVAALQTPFTGPR